MSEFPDHEGPDPGHARRLTREQARALIAVFLGRALVLRGMRPH